MVNYHLRFLDQSLIHFVWFFFWHFNPIRREFRPVSNHEWWSPACSATYPMTAKANWRGVASGYWASDPEQTVHRRLVAVSKPWSEYQSLNICFMKALNSPLHDTSKGSSSPVQLAGTNTMTIWCSAQSSLTARVRCAANISKMRRAGWSSGSARSLRSASR